MLDEIPGKDQPSGEPPARETLSEPETAVKPAPGRRGLFGKIVHGVLQLTAGLVAVSMLAFIVLVWRLSEGPVSIAFLAPYISSSISSSIPGLNASFRDTLLVWAGWDRAIDVRIIDLRFSAENGESVGFIPETAFSLSAEALLKGQLAASELELFEPTLSIHRDESGGFELGFAGGNAASEVSAAALLEWLSDEQGGDNPAAFLDLLTITNADLVIKDEVAGRSWVTPDAHVSIRRVDSGFTLASRFFADLDGSVAEFLLSGRVERDSGLVEGRIAFEGLNPRTFAAASDAFGFLSRIDVIADGQISVKAALNGRVDSIGFDLTGTNGVIALPAPLDTAISAETVRVAGTFDAVINRLSLETFDVAFAPDTSIEIPGIPQHRYNLRSIAGAGAYQDGERRLTIDRLDARVGELDVTVTGLVDNAIDAPSVMLDINVPTIPVASLKDYWPASVGEDAYNWVIPNITDGRIENLRAALEGGTDSDGVFDIYALDGGFAFDDLVITYLESMPEVSGASGNATFDHDRIDFTIDRARSYDMPITGASVAIVGISGDNEQASIRVPTAGTFRQTMELIDRDPLNFAEELGIDPESVTGDAQADLAFDFPLLRDLAWEHVTFNAFATVADVAVPDGLFGLDVRDAAFEIEITNAGMDIIGDLKLEGYATNINWRQEFDPASRVENTYTLNVWVDQVEGLADLGLRTGPFAGDLIKGDMPLWLNVIENRDGNAVLSARADLTGIDLNLAALEWEKPSGVAGEANVEIKLRDGDIYEIASFRMTAPELFIEGRADYDDQTLKLSRVELLQVNVGRTDLNGLLIPRENGVWDADFSGASLDLAGLWDEVFESDLMASGDSLLPSLVLSTRFDRVWLSEDEYIEQFTSAFVREKENWRTIYITTVLEGKDTLGIKLAPAAGDDQGRVLTMWSKDAGAVLRLLRINDNVIGGDFNLRGRFDDSVPDAPLVGQMQISEFRVINAPTLTKVVSVMALTGILEALGGEGLYFSQLEIPFSYGDGILEMTSAQANGPSLGFTASGKIYTHADVVDIQGTVVPAYMINSLLGNIPLIGNIFSGGEAGGGVFAVRYSMSGSREDPDVSVNPLSALTPGFLRNLFGLFDSGGSATAVPEKPRRD